MASSNKTKKLKLNQWESSDKPTMTDFNEDNRKLEEELARIAPEGVTSWNSGNVPIETGTWVPDFGPNALYGFNAGKYMRIGNMVHISLISNVTFKEQGLIEIKGLPYHNLFIAQGVVQPFVKPIVSEIFNITPIIDVNVGNKILFIYNSTFDHLHLGHLYADYLAELGQEVPFRLGLTYFI